MTLFSLATKNMKGNFKNYLVYFVSFVFSIVIYYTFVSLQYNEKILDNILESATMAFLFLASSIVLLIFVAIFILYSSAFFTRKRKREVGLYSMLGLRKKTIGRMLFYENLLMGLLALVIGILFGTLLSKLFSMVLIKLMGATAEVDFGISFEAILQTVLVFMVIILFTSIQGYRLIYKFKLIELFHAEKKGEVEPKTSLVSTIIGIILLTVSYWLILRPFPEELTGTYVFTNYGSALLILIIGTHLFFSSVTVFLLKVAKKNKARYYRGTNLIETSQLMHRVRGSARTFTIIALLSSFTISLFGATYSGYYGNEKASEEEVPFSYSHLSKGEEFDTTIEEIIKEDEKHPVMAKVTIPVIEVDGELSFELGYEAQPFKLISESTYNQVSDALNRDQNVSLSQDEVAVVKPRLTEFTDSDFYGKEITIPNIEDTSKLTFVDMVEGSILPFDYPDFFVIVDDEIFNEAAKQRTPLVYKAYEVEDEKTTEVTSMKLRALIGEDFQVPSAYYLDYKSGKEGNALNLFIFGFLGLVFLAATGSIIYFKQLTEANEVKPNYEILRKIGVSKKDIRKSIKKQTLFVFGLPLTVGILHGSAILYFTSNFMSNLIGTNMLVPMITAMVAFIGIYIGYYLLTVNTYNGIVNK
ncbi:ABC transporter permease [Ferdinandcohnia quinoae]|uniref:ABC transporter permease n=1 Tax=Fredinandcohnia quinoae TaxID=2918902 RepID=A0AAW5DV33_9BACI|nr:ABC transporter permease [Fredinandcohnia sp. SECRCQ15]MCH1624496.1 ABC transporter permease [Fredinandcohnia sp. SECRCQ15]